MAAGLAVGALYSLPPFRLKRFPVAASLCISGVRSVVVNLGVYWHFAGQIDPPVIALCLFVLPFSLAIAILKDVPDIEGDRRYSIRTFTVRLGPERVFRAGLAALLIAYAGMIVVAPPAAEGLRESGRPGGRPRARRDAAPVLGEDRESALSHQIHAVLHAGVGALLPRVPAGPRRLSRKLVIFDVRARTTRHGWPVRRGHPPFGQVGLSAMSIASEADQQPRQGRPPTTPSQRFVRQAEPNTITASQARAARRREARRDEQAVASWLRELSGRPR